VITFEKTIAMPVSISARLKIKPGMRLLTIDAPPDFRHHLTDLPPGVTISDKEKSADQLHWFVVNRAQLEKTVGRVMKLLRPEVVVWVYFPKRSSKIQTDLSRDHGWDALQAAGDNFTWITLISFDDTWSVFGFRPKSAQDKMKEAGPKPQREIFNWVNPKTKEVRLPDDLATALKKSKLATSHFATLSFTNKKEFVEWIVSAKREETRAERIRGTVERLVKKWKNPREM
jgi:hypothetical protein